MCFKQSKCDFNMEEIPILEVIVGKGQIKIEQEKIKVVKEWKTPMKVKDMESFLGFTNFYRRFVYNFSHIAGPLNKLKGKKEWKWEKEHQKAFEELKKKIISQPVLALSRREGKFRVEMDVSEHAIGGVLGAVHTGVEVHRMYLEMSRLVERPWLQLMCCAICLLRGRNFK